MNGTFSEALGFARKTLARDAEAEQLVILAYRKANGKEVARADFYSSLSQPYPEAAWNVLRKWVQEYAAGKPLQHVTGVQFFLEHEYEVGPEVLVPRPETELLVLTAIDEIVRRIPNPTLGLEIGIGSGIISIELLHRFTCLKMIASEVSAAAALRAASNAERILGSNFESRLRIVSAGGVREVIDPLLHFLENEKADFLISNPPYLDPSAKDEEAQVQVVATEPKIALFAPADDPLFFYRIIAEQADRCLRPDGRVFLEIPHERADAIAHHFTNQGWSARILNDLTNRPRVLVASREAIRNG